MNIIKKFEKIGFKTPRILVNKYGIKVYIGTPNNEDWCIEIPAQYVSKKMEKCSPLTAKYYKHLGKEDFAYYCISEEECLRIANEWITFIELNEHFFVKGENEW